MLAKLGKALKGGIVNDSINQKKTTKLKVINIGDEKDIYVWLKSAQKLKTNQLQCS